ncbi:hypothetical protein Prum_002110 [Phytohabitans rumicis]|uniref:Nucleotide exchange factor GrpE n=1 Tax=Phytohabitans rumicis TaxID=1076125 RepID=A0A6V8KW83_9ACTN|nr:hypothetical protein Prum_002110 [Phytohabitans rumicis]
MVDPVVERLDALTGSVEDMRRDMAASRDRAAAQERVIERLHEENERLRSGERMLLLRPVLTDLLRLRNDLLRQAGTLPEEMSIAQTAELLESFAYSVEMALSRCGVEVVRPEVGTAFDPAGQRATRVVAAPSPQLDGTVAGVLGDGYLDTVTNRALAAATVLVQRWTEPTIVEAPAGPSN